MKMLNGDVAVDVQTRLLLIYELLEEIGIGTPSWFPTELQPELLDLACEQIKQCAAQLELD
jgi:hypothetical protein